MPLRIFASRGADRRQPGRVLHGRRAVFAMWYFLVALPAAGAAATRRIEAGLAFLPMTVAIIVASQVAGRLTGRIGPGPRARRSAWRSIALGMAGPEPRRRPTAATWPTCSCPSVVAAGGIGFSFVPVTIAADRACDAQRGGAGLGPDQHRRGRSAARSGWRCWPRSRRSGPRTWRATCRRGEALTEGFQRAFLVGAGFAVLGALLSVTLLARATRVPAARARARLASPRRRPARSPATRAAQVPCAVGRPGSR